MKKLTSGQIRQMFLDFFKEKGHDVEPSASLIPVNDPTLLWINSGVATLKKYFDGTVVPKNPRITNAQKSIRTNDIENVGKTARHQTFFEMLGNFSVGDYFKNEAIPWAWEFLTSPKWLALDPHRLYVTVFPKDKETYRIWHEVVGLPKDHIVLTDDNFWDIGGGPCGPDSEIFFDRGQKYNNVPEDDPENYPGGENERYLEIWNIVFSEFNHLPDGRYVEQPHKNIDTGMGLERLVSIIQDAPTNFETDLFMPIINETERLSGKKYGADENNDVSFKIIADHARAVTFAIGDGALPGNEGRGYVLRRLIRRAALNGRKLGIAGAFLYKLVPIVGQIMESYYLSVLEQKDYIEKVIKSEEERFGVTLSDGMALLDQTIAKTKAAGKKVISGNDAFKLFDTYGFPVELTNETAKDEGLSVDMAGFKAEMEKQRQRARQARTDEQSMGSQNKLLLDLKDESIFTGYTELTTDHAELIDLIVNNQLQDQVTDGKALMIFDKTPFYAEMGGQVADIGTIKNDSGQLVGRVLDVQHAPNGQNLHTVEVLGTLRKGDHYTLNVDAEYRHKIMRNHTATHLLDQSLRNVLGEHTHQAGSLVEPDYLRFDFTNFGQVTAEQLKQVERMVNEQIWKAIPVKTVETDIESAKKMGAIAMFSEKYGDRVRVVQIGNFNAEFCGGTHVTNTADIGIFKIVSESGVGAGVRRIEAVTSQAAYEFLDKQQQLLSQVSTSLKATKLDEVPQKVAQLQAQLHDVQKDNSALQAKLASQQAGQIFDNVETINGYQLVASQIKVESMKELRQLADQWKTKQVSDILVLGAANDDKANLIVAVSDDAVKRGIKAGDLIKAIASHINGGGGGRPTLAQAGGKNPAGLPQALQAAKEWLQQQ
ncbi:MAG: alanine--tRNA ligase [Candidatus Paralactobacillus gallistercoris]|uniref:Alanine--tRNA ligase n=1 Tax=Candidatus Paralactobacillus gallistercoris TaxID=2838724 RepID=A0A948TJV7_9LACO|nr:alanine--tRNA ligase [Candidatus Paralactobacillus gallistercoris]